MFDPRVDPPGYFTGFLEFLAGLVFFPLVFYSSQQFLRGTRLGLRLVHHFQLRNNGIYDICNKLTSSTFAILACSCGFSVLRHCDKSLLGERFYILNNYLLFGLSYFFYDCVSMYMVHSTETKEEVTVSASEVVRFCVERPLIILHHVLVPLVGFPAMMIFRGGEGDCMLAFSFLMEFSTPFVSLRVILCHLNMKDSKLYILNGLLMLASFFLCRVLMFPIIYLWYSRVSGLSSLMAVPIWVHAAVAGLWFPQLVWFLKMVKGSIKILRNIKTQESKKLD